MPIPLLFSLILIFRQKGWEQNLLIFILNNCRNEEIKAGRNGSGDRALCIHVTLSNYSTIGATQVMEFQLKYDSFRICFCQKKSEGGVVSRSWRGRNRRRREYKRQIFAAHVLHLSTHSSLISPPSIKEMAYFRHFTSRRTLRLESGQKQDCFDKKSLKWDAENWAFW